MTILSSQKEVEVVREGGRLLAGFLEDILQEIKPGIKTRALEDKARQLLQKNKIEPAFLGYQGYPAILCVSVNEEIVHTPPSERVLQEGDIVSVDMGIRYKGFYFDMAKTVMVGQGNFELKRMLKVGEKVLKLAVKKARAGNTTGDIGNLIERYSRAQGFEIVRELCGHGIGKNLHEKPDILNYGKRGEGEELYEGMLICIEPMLTTGNGKIKKRGKFSFVTQDGKPSCHFEHTVLVTREKGEILTKV